MPAAPIRFADILRAHGESFLRERGALLTPAQRRLLTQLVACRTAALGGHRYGCDRCSHVHIAYNSCRNRHCPTCQAANRAEWLEARSREVLDVQYFHVVFTLPEPIAAIALQNKQALYQILFQASAQTLLQLAADPKHLGAQIGFFSVLHTWGQTLAFHPHVHCIVPAGGLSDDQTRWVPCRPNFFLPVKVLSDLFRGKFLSALRDAHRKGALYFQGSLTHLNSPDAFNDYLQPLYDIRWIVYAKPPFGGPDQLLKYLARYTHRVAISDRRLIKLHGGRVVFRYKDYSDQNRVKCMSLTAHEFIRRFLLHLLPKGFPKIRYYGFMANPVRKVRLDLCRMLIPSTSTAAPHHPPPAVTLAEPRCPACKVGRLVVYLGLVPAEPHSWTTLPTPTARAP